MRKTPEERFRGKYTVNPTTGCWDWTAGQNGHGYGQFYTKDKGCGCGAHRWWYEFHRGPVPDGLQVDHLCRNRACVNPAHMECVTPGENVRRGNSGEFAKAKTHCPQGHRYDNANTTINKRGSRVCRRCVRKQSADYRKNHPERVRVTQQKNYARHQAARHSVTMVA